MFFSTFCISSFDLYLYFKSNEKFISTCLIPAYDEILSTTSYKNYGSYRPFVTVEYLQSGFADTFNILLIIASISSKNFFCISTSDM